jgi:hypothetical protein
MQMRENVRSGRRENFFVTDNSFIDHYARQLQPTDIAVYHALERYANCHTRSTFVGTARIAEVLNVSQRTVQRSLKALEDLKLIRIVQTETFKTYFIVPVPARTKATTTPLFDAIEENEFTLASDMDVAWATPESHLPTPVSRTASPVSHMATPLSRPGVTGDAPYKEEQNLLNKTQEQDSLNKTVEEKPEMKNVAKDVAKQRFLLDKLSARIVRILDLPATGSLVSVVLESLKAEVSYTRLPAAEVAAAITRAATEDRSRGIAIDRFYFENTKWRSNGKANRAEQRKLDNLEVNARVKQRLREKFGTS